MTEECTWEPEKATCQSDGLPDTHIVPYVVQLNDHGIETYQSCAGHVHDDGSRTDGHLWLAPDALTPDLAREMANQNGLYGVCRRYAREECWELSFPGLADGEEELRWNLRLVFRYLGVPLP